MKLLNLQKKWALGSILPRSFMVLLKLQRLRAILEKHEIGQENLGVFQSLKHQKEKEVRQWLDSLPSSPKP